jgi:hypothetical protein
MIFGEKKLLDIKCVWLSVKFCPKHFSFYKQFREILSQMYIGLHVKYQLLFRILQQAWIRGAAGCLGDNREHRLLVHTGVSEERSAFSIHLR